MFEDLHEVMEMDAVTRRRLCGFGKWSLTLAGADRQRAEELVHDRTYTSRQVARYFATKGATFNDQVVSRHRNKQCCGQR